MAIRPTKILPQYSAIHIYNRYHEYFVSATATTTMHTTKDYDGDDAGGNEVHRGVSVA